mmetsp:Transcript_13937/g.22755  ORF Transcript_13937/g.22755 Transcript_13937/m.22755 type:complete len:225 (-) Transcript_13937:54-728(-)
MKLDDACTPCHLGYVRPTRACSLRVCVAALAADSSPFEETAFEPSQQPPHQQVPCDRLCIHRSQFGVDYVLCCTSLLLRNVYKSQRVDPPTAIISILALIIIIIVAPPHHRHVASTDSSKEMAFGRYEGRCRGGPNPEHFASTSFVCDQLYSSQGSGCCSWGGIIALRWLCEIAASSDDVFLGIFRDEFKQLSFWPSADGKRIDGGGAAGLRFLFPAVPLMAAV